MLLEILYKKMLTQVWHSTVEIFAVVPDWWIIHAHLVQTRRGILSKKKISRARLWTHVIEIGVSVIHMILKMDRHMRLQWLKDSRNQDGNLTSITSEVMHILLSLVLPTLPTSREYQTSCKLGSVNEMQLTNIIGTRSFFQPLLKVSSSTKRVSVL